MSISAPTDITNLRCWLKADAGVYKDAGSTLAVNNDTVQEWHDQSGNNQHATQTTSGKRPTFKTSQQNGLPAIEWTIHS